jgi:hypothetical protein
MIDNLEWLSQRRDHHATARDAFYADDKWAEGNAENEWVERYYAVLVEIETARKRLAVMQEVLVQRIVLVAQEARTPAVKGESA